VSVSPSVPWQRKDEKQRMATEQGFDFCCGVCEGAQVSGIHEAREMMYGLRTRFHYAQCARCGSLWLLDPPADFAPYYPRKYYSFANLDGGPKRQIKRYLRAKRDAAYFGQGGLLGRFLAQHFEDGALLSVSRLSVARNARILDVGCGSGGLLQRMTAFGFTCLWGVDPFLPPETSNGNGVKITRARLEDATDRKYDLVMFHHSLEHVADPKSTLRTVARLLAPQGKCLVRLPVLAQAWEQYGTNWVQLSPPRHMWIPTEKAMMLLADSTGLKVEQVEYDSTPFQFWGSELCQKDVPLNTADPLNLKGRLRVREMNELRKRTQALNRDGRGDQAVFLLSA
jgi:SAM-dependent methyltransferase